MQLLKSMAPLASAAILYCLCIADYATAMAFMAIGGFMTGFTRQAVLMCTFTCDLSALTTSDECNLSGGIQEAYWAQFGDIDWIAIAADPLKFNPTTQQLIGTPTMVLGAVWKLISPERKTATYTFTWTEESDVYTQEIVLNFEGTSNAMRLAFTKSVKCCNLVLLIIDNNCQQRLVGVEWTGTKFIKQSKTLRFGTHVSTSGTKGSAKPANNVTLVGESDLDPMFANIDLTTLPL